MKNPPRFKVVRWTTAKGEQKECYYHRGERPKREMTPLGSDYAIALEKWAKIEGVRIKQPSSGSLASVYEKYIEWAHKRELSGLAPSTTEGYEKCWRQLKKVFGECRIDELQPSWMLKYFEKRSSQIRAKKELKFLSVLCNWATSRQLSNGNNPCTNIMRLLKVNERRDIYVTDSDYYLVYKHATELVRDAADVCLMFTNRPAETAASRLGDVDGDELVVSLAKTEKKGLKEKRIYLDAEKKDYINRQKRKKVRSVYLVSDEKGQPLKPNGSKFRKEFNLARDLAEAEAKEKGIPFQRWQLRDIRAKSATEIAINYGIEAARLACGHTTQKQTADYIRSVKGAAINAMKAANGESDLI